MKTVLAFVFLYSNFLFASTPDLWIDCDTATGILFRDVDDGYVLAHALKNFPKRIAGISVSFGNVNKPRKQMEIVEKIVDLARVDMSLFQGASNEFDLQSPGSKALARLLKNTVEPNSITILALSRMTTIEGALRIYPEGRSKIKEILFVGGRTTAPEPKVGKRQWTLPDSNFWGDEKAFREILARDVKITLFPTDIAIQFKITDADLSSMKSSGDLGHWLARKSRSWMVVWKVILGENGFFPFDLMASAYVSLKSEIKCFENIPLKILPLPDYHFGKNGSEIKNRIVVSYDFINSEHKVDYCYKVSDEFHDKLMSQLLKN